MKKCKNCGATLDDEALFCDECGSEVETQLFCQNCGSDITESENFCEHCGADLNSSNSESFISKYKFPIMAALGVAIVLLLVGLIALSSQPSEDIELPAQTVTVGAEYFKIPGNFYSTVPMEIDADYGVVSSSQTWTDGYDSFSISVLAGGPNVDLESVLASQGGVYKNMMGHDGYYNEIDIRDYSFAFILDGKICVVETTSVHLFDEITVY